MSTRGLPHPFPLVSPSSLSSALSRAVRLLQDSVGLLTSVPHATQPQPQEESEPEKGSPHPRGEEGGGVSTQGLPHPFPLISPSSLSPALSRVVRLLQDSAALLTPEPHAHSLLR